ncbi:MAG: hypothetical protein B7X86_08700 [Sphingobacteriales bacterium 17-39-43]|nr:MAG: hypothetical protein B7Y24_03715 [Sphingobacteriales bacterium 16-39-50]OZA24557.1 MAG: hypothetical protein B7X86_08700 [Sphingobacteriales bacterium 17-39-43]
MILFFSVSSVRVLANNFSFEFYSGTFNFELDPGSEIDFSGSLSATAVQNFYDKLDKSKYHSILNSLLAYKEKHQLNDWIYYQLIRKTAQQISPKAENYHRYTLYKWFLLSKSGYDARLSIGNNRIIFYVRNDENINDIPFFSIEGNKYMCLNYHDYGKIDFEKDKVYPVNVDIPEAKNAFSYKVTRMPDFKPESYNEKEIQFSYRSRPYHFQVKLNSEVENIFKNYPGVDFESYFNIPLSRETYHSLIPILRKNIERMNQKKGVDYLMRFTRYAFLYQTDENNFGKEKRLSPEQTLFSKYSDCDDRAALFFYLVKEIYNLPMIALLYPTHISMAVQFEKAQGKSIIYKGQKYSVCEPTPQNRDLKIGQIAANLEGLDYKVVYQYNPSEGK